MQFLTLRHATDPAAAPSPDENRSNQWSQSTIILLDCEQHERPCRFVVQEANVSVAVCGWDRGKWTCWAFSNTQSDPIARDEEEPNETDMQEDYIATDGNGPEDGIVMDADKPIWNARIYWLRVVDVRMRIIYKEWKCLVMNTEARIKAWVRLRPLHANQY